MSIWSASQGNEPLELRKVGLVGNCRGDALSPYQQKGIRPLPYRFWREQVRAFQAHNRVP
jgi:hypothetical protein